MGWGGGGGEQRSSGVAGTATGVDNYSSGEESVDHHQSDTSTAFSP